MDSTRNSTPSDTRHPESVSHGTTADQISEMESEGPGAATPVTPVARPDSRPTGRAPVPRPVRRVAK